MPTASKSSMVAKTVNADRLLLDRLLIALRKRAEIMHVELLLWLQPNYLDVLSIENTGVLPV
jgi:hypothetical protein